MSGAPFHYLNLSAFQEHTLIDVVEMCVSVPFAQLSSLTKTLVQIAWRLSSPPTIRKRR